MLHNISLEQVSNEHTLSKLNKDIDISIIIANWNGEKILRDCLKSVFEKTKGIEFEVIIVDDCSTDRSVELIKTKFPDVLLIQNPINLGFAKTNNNGVTYAEGKYIFLLNNDTILKNNALKIFFDFMESNSHVAVCGGTLFNIDGTSQLSYGNFPSFSEALMGAFMLPELFPGASWVKRKGIIPNVQINKPIEVDYITGADLFIRRSVVDKFGLFDERFEAYCEETDLCFRIKKDRKWKIFYLPSAEITHLFSYSYDSIKEKKIKTQYHSYNIFLEKHHGKFYSFTVRLLYAWQYFVKLIVRSVIFIIRPDTQQKNKILEALYTIKYSLFPN